MIIFKNIFKSYVTGSKVVTALNDINIMFSVGEFVIIHGESGSGKSTFLNLLAGNDIYSSGSIVAFKECLDYYDNEDYDNYRKTIISQIYQEYRLIDDLSVYKNIELISPAEENLHEKIMKIIEKVGLAGKEKVLTKNLSGGQKQRVAIARALMKKTPVILADEPTGNLDSKNAKTIVALLKEISLDKLVIVVSHDVEIFSGVATRFVEFQNGKIVEDKVVTPVSENTTTVPTSSHNFTKKQLGKFAFRHSFSHFMSNITITAMMALIMVIFSSAMILSKSLFQTNNYDYYNYLNYNNSVEATIINKDKNSFSEADLNSLKNNEKISSLTINDFVSTTKIKSPSSDDYYSYSFTPFNVDEGKNLEILKGALPKNKGEVVLAVNKDRAANYEIDKKELFNFKLPTGVDNTLFSKEFIVVGLSSALETSNNNFIMFESDYFELSNILIQKKYQLSLKHHEQLFINDNFDSKSVDNYFLIPDKEVAVGEAKIAYNPDEHKKISEFFSGGSNFPALELQMGNNVFTAKKTFAVTTSSITSSSHNIAVQISPSDFNELFTEKFYEITVDIYNKFGVKETLDSLNNSGYAVYLDSLLYNDQISFSSTEIVMNFLILFAICILCGILCLGTLFMIHAMSKNERYDFNVLRAIGYKNYEIKIIIAFETAIKACIAGIVSFFVITLIAFLVTGIKPITSYLIHFYLLDYLLLTILTIVSIFLYFAAVYLTISKGTLKNINLALKGTEKND